METFLAKSLPYYQINKFRVPIVGWNEDVYIEYHGAIRAMRFLKIAFFLDNVTSGYEYLPKPEYYVKIAGVGYKKIATTLFSGFPFKITTCADDFNNFENVEKKNKLYWKEVDSVEWLSSLFKENYYESIYATKTFPIHDGTAASFFRYKWDGVQPQKVYLELPKIIYYINHDWLCDEPIEFPKDTYATILECKNANTLNIVEFGDEKTDNKDNEEITLEVTLSCKITFSDFDKKYIVKIGDIVLGTFGSLQEANEWADKNL